MNLPQVDRIVAPLSCTGPSRVNAPWKPVFTGVPLLGTLGPLITIPPLATIVTGVTAASRSPKVSSPMKESVPLELTTICRVAAAAPLMVPRALLLPLWKP